MTATCPSDLALETYLLEPKTSPLAPHLETCAPCSARIARMQAEGDEFRQFVFPATVEAVEAAAEKRSRSWLRWPMLLAPLAAAAAVAVTLVVRMPGPDDGYLGVKGGGLGLAVYVNGGEGVAAVADGAPVPASAALRFKVQPEGDCYLWILSVDAKGAVSRLYPPAGAVADLRGSGPVPGGAVLDGQPGPERIFAACAPNASTSWAEVQAAAASAAGGADKVRAARGLGGALAKAKQATVLLEKRP
jgi:hypothetical protein